MDPKDLRELFLDGNPVLFLGAGPSIAQGGPSWSGLAEKIAAHFKEEEVNLPLLAASLFAKGKRAEVERFVDDLLSPLPPSASHISLLSLPWKAAFTTNYDLTAEKLRQMHLQQEIRVFDDGSTSSAGARLTLPIYKLMGSTPRRYPQPGHMLLSASDISRGYQLRRPYLERLRDAMTSSNLLIVGSSLDDMILLNLLEEARAIEGASSGKRIVLATAEAPNKEIQILMAAYKIEFCKANVETVAAALAGASTPPPPPKTRIIQVGARQFELSPALEDQMAYAGLLLDANYEGHTYALKADFYRQSKYSRVAFREKWDFARDLHVTASSLGGERGTILSLQDTLARIREWRRRGGVPRLLIEGGPGSAKTLTALRLAHDWCVAGGLALYIDLGPWYWGPEPTTTFLSDLNAFLVTAGVASDPSYPGLLLVVDNGTRRPEMVRSLANQLRKDKLGQIVVLVTGKPNETSSSQRATFDATWWLDSRVTELEKGRFRSFILANAAGATSAFVDSRLKETDSGTFFGLLYGLLEPTRQPLESSINSAFEDLARWTQELLLGIATFHHCNLPFLESLSWRRADRNIVEIFKEIDEGQLRDIVFRSETTPPVLRVLNDAVASTLYSHKVVAAGRSAADIILPYVPLVRASFDEIQPFQQALVVSAKNGKALSEGDAERTLRAAATYHGTRPLHHHHGLSLMKKGDFPEAEKALRNALASHDRYERIEMVHHSLGELYHKWGRREAQNDTGRAQRLYARARDEYSRAKLEVPDFAYHGLAKLSLAEARLYEGQPEQKAKLLDALAQATMGLLTVSTTEGRDLFNHARDEAVASLASLVYTLQDAQAHARITKDGAGFLFLALRVISERPLVSLTKAEIGECLALLNEGLTFSPKDRALLHLRFRLRYLLDPLDETLLELAENLKGVVPSQEISRLKAKCFAAQSRFDEGLKEIRNASLIGVARPPIAEVTDEDYVRDATGRRSFSVQEAAGKTVIRLWREVTLPTDSFTSGERVALLARFGYFLPVPVPAI